MEQSNHIWDQFTSGNASYKVKRIKEIEEIEEKIKKEELNKRIVDKIKNQKKL